MTRSFKQIINVISRQSFLNGPIAFKKSFVSSQWLYRYKAASEASWILVSPETPSHSLRTDSKEKYYSSGEQDGPYGIRTGISTLRC
jgi:hypothetical protein